MTKEKNWGGEAGGKSMTQHARSPIAQQTQGLCFVIVSELVCVCVSACELRYPFAVQNGE